MTNEEIQAYLDDNGYPPHVVEAGAPGLIARWRQFVDEVELGYRYRLADYRHDLDLRGILEIAGLAAEVADADARFAAMLTARHVRVWESASGDAWWDFGIPRNPGRELRRDLERAGFPFDEE